MTAPARPDCAFSAELFVNAVKQIVVANKDYIPPEGKVRQPAFLLAPSLTPARFARAPSTSAPYSLARGPSWGSHPRPSIPSWCTPHPWPPTSRSALPAFGAHGFAADVQHARRADS